MSAGVQYAWLMGTGALTPRVDWTYQSYATNGSVNLPQRHPDNIVPGYALVNAQVTFTPQAGKWNVSFGATNLFNKFYWEQLGAASSVTERCRQCCQRSCRHPGHAARVVRDAAQGLLSSCERGEGVTGHALPNLRYHAPCMSKPDISAVGDHFILGLRPSPTLHPLDRALLADLRPAGVVLFKSNFLQDEPYAVWTETYRG